MNGLQHSCMYICKWAVRHAEEAMLRHYDWSHAGVMCCRNLKSAGFTPEERESFERLLMQKGFRDVFRERHPEIEAYTYWNYLAKGRGRNGWRIDFFLVMLCDDADFSLWVTSSSTFACIPHT